MNAPQDKMQAAKASGTCPVCRGTKVVEIRGGQKLTCHACRGTGVTQGSYATK